MNINTMAESLVFHLRAPSRLHFGLLPRGSVGSERQGGMGVMINHPTLEITVQSSNQWRFTGVYSSRLTQIANECLRQVGQVLPPLHIEVIHAPPKHSGFGSGTQITLATSLIISRWLQKNAGAQDSNIKTSGLGRGKRSLVGSEGFSRGGLIYDPGDHEYVETPRNYSIPSQWRWLAITGSGKEGLSGQAENEFFAQSESHSDLRANARRVVEDQLLASLDRGSFPDFSNALSEYGKLCGQLFSRVQGGLYCSPVMADVARRLKEGGVEGVGQSSWGPTVFGLFSSQQDAENFTKNNSWLLEDGLTFYLSDTSESGVLIQEY